MPRRRYVEITLKLSLAPGVTAAQARREVRTRINEGCIYHSHIEESDVRAVKIEGRGVVKGPVRREPAVTREPSFRTLGDFMRTVRGPAV